MIRNGKRDCFSNIDENTILENCTHDQLFLCLDQSRCLPKNLRCNGYINCIDGSDEIEGCNYITTVFRHFISYKNVVHD